MSSAGLEGRAELVKPTDGVVSRLVNRRISTRISLFIARYASPSPDLVSVIAAALVALGGALFASGRPLLGGVVAQLGSIIDGVDGEIARLTGRQSKAGGFFDTMLDRLADIALILGVSMAAMYFLSPQIALALAVLAVSADLLVSYLHAVGEKVSGSHPALIGRIPNIAGRDTRIFILFLAGITGAIWQGLLVMTILSYFYVVAKSIEILRYLESK
jgi:CDP-L-myo-inositol myo-inositolphosphotransferase